jgi:hypothetical protein
MTIDVVGVEVEEGDEEEEVVEKGQVLSPREVGEAPLNHITSQFKIC